MHLWNRNKVPVLVHIPKNAGTYVVTTALRRLVHWHSSNKTGYVRLLKVTSQRSIFTVICNFHTSEHKEDPYIMQHLDSIRKGEHTHRLGRCSDATLERYLNKGDMDVLFCVADAEVLDSESGHVDMRTGLFECHRVINRAGKQPLNFTMLREPYSRQRSLYTYLMSDQSKHEPSHGMFEASTLEQFIAGDQVEDSWFIRVMLGMHHSVPLDMAWYNTCCDFLDHHRFVIRDIKHTNELLKQLLLQCHGCTEDMETYEEHGNNTRYDKQDKLPFDQLPVAVQKRFQHRTRFDQMLWDRYCIAS